MGYLSSARSLSFIFPFSLPPFGAPSPAVGAPSGSRLARLDLPLPSTLKHSRSSTRDTNTVCCYRTNQDKSPNTVTFARETFGQISSRGERTANFENTFPRKVWPRGQGVGWARVLSNFACLMRDTRPSEWCSAHTPPVSVYRFTQSTLTGDRALYVVECSVIKLRCIPDARVSSCNAVYDLSTAVRPSKLSGLNW